MVVTNLIATPNQNICIPKVNVNNNVKITRICMLSCKHVIQGSTGLIQTRAAHEILSRFTATSQLEERAVSSQIKRVKG